MTDYRVESCQMRFICEDVTIRNMHIFIKGGYMRFESKNNSSWSCYHRDNSLSNCKLDHIFTNDILDKLWNDSVTKKFE